MLPAEEQPLPAAVSPTAESPGYITESEPEMEPEENNGDDEKSEGDSIDYPTSENDADDDGDDLSEDDVDDEDEEESSDSEEEEEEHLDPTVPAPAQYNPYVQLVMEAPPLPDYIPGPEALPLPEYIPEPEAPPSPDYILGPEYPEYLPPADDMLPAEEQPLPAVVSPTAESPGYVTESEPKMEPEKNDGDDEKSEGDSIDYPTSGGDNDANDDGDDLSEDDADDEDEEESLDSEEEEEEYLASTVPAPALYSFVSASEETKPFEEGETAATPPPFGYRVAARISVQSHILMPFCSESEVERLLAIPTPPLSIVSPTSYPLLPFLMPLPIFTPLPTSSFPLPLSIPSTSGSESIPEADIPLRKIARFTTPTSRYEIGESSVAAAAARQIRPTLTIVDKRRADDKLIGRPRRERRYFRTLFHYSY
nr:hypothetical protein [Tanacetum cinerariifolium]